MKQLNRVTGRCKAKDLRKGRTLYRSGIGGVEAVVVESAVYMQGGTAWVDFSFPDWEWARLKGYVDECSLADMGIRCKGGYNNPYNRLFKKRKQADNWQEYLKVSGLSVRADQENQYYDEQGVDWE